jgi:hypothetical protein
MAVTFRLASIRQEARAEPPRDWTELSTRCLDGLARQALGDREGCRRIYDWLLPYEDRLAIGQGTLPFGPVGYVLGLLAEDPAARRAHLDAAAARCEGAGLTWWADKITSAR